MIVSNIVKRILGVAPPIHSLRGRDLLSDVRYLLGRDPEIIFDVGGNEGQSVKNFLNVYPCARVHSFEPCKDPFSRMQELFSLDPRVVLHKKAMGDTNGDCTINVFAKSYNSSLCYPAKSLAKWTSQTDADVIGTEQVPMCTLDEIIDQERINRIDFLKIDVQGTEKAVLKGATSILRRGLVDVVCLELLFVEMYEKQAWYYELAAYMQEFGYNLFGLYNIFTQNGGQIKWADGLFRRTNALASVLSEG